MLKRLIKIKGKESFDDLTIAEVVKMIEADSALAPAGNEYFDASALDEFLTNGRTYKKPELETIRNEINEKIYLDVEGQVTKEINTEFLREYSRTLVERYKDI